MMTLLWGLASILILIILLLGTILVSPVKIAFHWRSSPQNRVVVGARLFGGLTPQIPIFDSAKARTQAAPDAIDEKPAKQSKTDRAFGGKAADLVRRAPGLLKKLLRAFHVERLNIDAEIGLQDPADTGYLYGLLATGTYSIPAARRSVHIRPVFSAPAASGNADILVSVVPAALLWPVAQTGWYIFGPES